MAKIKSIHAIRQEIDKKFIGFVPQNTSVKPVHIANGLFKRLYGEAFDSKDISRLSYVHKANGHVPKGQSDEEVKQYFETNKRMVGDQISLDSFKLFRLFLQDIINVDRGVFSEKTSMIAFSLSSKMFLNTDSIYQDAGEFIASIIAHVSPDMVDVAKDALNNEWDPISLLFSPAKKTSESIRSYQNDYFEDVVSYKCRSWGPYLQQLTDSSATFASNLLLIPNKLVRLRSINFFAIYQLIRYLFALESLYFSDKQVQPLLFDCSNDSTSSIAKASQVCMINSIQSVSRVYIYFFKRYLIEHQYSIDELLTVDVPVYDESKKPKHPSEYAEIWSMAKNDVMEEDNEDRKYVIFAQALYDMLILDASAEIKLYLTKLGSVSGIFYPPTSTIRNQYKRIVFSQEYVEILVKSCIGRDELVTMNELLNRLYDRFNIIVGGRDQDETILKRYGITQLDEQALQENQSYFEDILRTLNFAEIMADGILHIRIGEQRHDQKHRVVNDRNH
jgi:hypothetical protein